MVFFMVKVVILAKTENMSLTIKLLVKLHLGSKQALILPELVDLVIQALKNYKKEYLVNYLKG